MRIALTGGIACGKSLAARFLRENGVETIDADDIVHELIPDPSERRRIAAEVFTDGEKRRALEARIHPIVRGRIDGFLSDADGQLRIAIIPLLFETGWEKDYDLVCTVASSEVMQISRMLATRGYSREEALARLNAQLPVAEKARRSDYVIINDGTEAELAEKVRFFVAWLTERIRQTR